MKKALKIIPIALIASLFAMTVFVNDKNVAPIPVEAATSGYKVKVNIAITNDADYWYDARLIVNTKADNGRGNAREFYRSDNIATSLEYTGANYTSSDIYCGNEFPYSITLFTGIGAFWQYHYGEADVRVYINGINAAYRHISFGGWNYLEEYNEVLIDQAKYPYPKNINVNYSENIDPADESTQKVNLSAIDQYGVIWSTPIDSPITAENESFPENDTAERLDDRGFAWKLDSSLNSNHYSNYVFRFPTASSVYPVVEKKITVQFAFPLHLTIILDNEIVYKASGYEGETIQIPDLETPTGYYISNYKKTGVGTLNKDGDSFSFSFISGDVTLTAVLKAISYKIRFDKNGEGVTGTMLDKTVSYNAKGNPTLPVNYFKREGYSFIGWNTKADGSGTSYENRALFGNLSSIKGDVVILYAQWESLNPSVTASLFTDGTLGLIFGAVLAGGTLVGVSILLILKAKKKKA